MKGGAKRKATSSQAIGTALSNQDRTQMEFCTKLQHSVSRQCISLRKLVLHMLSAWL